MTDYKSIKYSPSIFKCLKSFDVFRERHALDNEGRKSVCSRDYREGGPVLQGETGRHVLMRQHSGVHVIHSKVCLNKEPAYKEFPVIRN